MSGLSPATGKKCQFCDRRFSRNEHLRRHQRHHTGEKPFQCHLCYKSYARSDVLARHVRNHGSESQEDRVNTEGREDREDYTIATEESAPEVSFELQQTNFASDQRALGLSHDGGISSSLDNQAVSGTTTNDNTITHAMQFAASEQMQSTEGFSISATGFDLSALCGYNLDFPSVFDALDRWITPAPTADQSMLPFSPSGQENRNATLFDAASLELSKRVQQAWPRRRAYPVIRVIRNMWRCAAEHTADNFFSNALLAGQSGSQNASSPSSRWNMDDECRARLMSDCETNLLPAESYTGGVTAPGSPHISVPSVQEEVEVEGLSPHAPRLPFPSTETLDMSIDFYFRRFHPVLPFLHKVTFDAKLTPSWLLLPICLIGLSILNPGGAEDLIRLYLGKLIRFSRLNLTYKGLGKGGAHQLLTSLASALLVLYLGLSCEKLVDEYQAHMLAIQTLFIADRHGMFSAHDGETVALDMFQSFSSPVEQWKAWARVESLKRLVTCLISIDSAYTRMLDLAANIGIERVEVVLPCDSTLFEAPSANVFFCRVESGASMMTHQVDLAAVPLGGGSSISALDSLGVRALLDVLSLREAAYRHKLLSKATSSSRLTSFVPSLAYAQNGSASNIARALVSIATTKMPMIHQDAPAVLTWNHLCLLLCADIDRVQTACSRTGLEASHKAMRDLLLWSRTSSARRAAVHSAQIFSILSQRRVSDFKTLLPELVLSNAALVMAMYICVSHWNDHSYTEPTELLQSPDWSGIGDEGFCMRSRLEDNDRLATTVNNQAWRFIVQGGAFTFGGETYSPGAVSARKMVLVYAQLVDEISPRPGSEHSRLLRTIGDFLGAAAEQLTVPLEVG
ncbi:uncharacterized protein A1O5_11125 [Cladophialophora psammophila CBS 110553]|uniref:C2H2-type domain-containing protein n=1 Tax=Cladophialophora psammophila CBS 110553 TaxID=1182543 RepID=W9WCB1_9EURO|nr:uncharacterized protein A1O5_11125 [Cladophialophora psammophila CBS 110553]EXJ65598.1 hypothetical protein A1O5_11125 [Cladophialophora psammophila CBS 110553]